MKFFFKTALSAIGITFMMFMIFGVPAVLWIAVTSGAGTGVAVKLLFSAFSTSCFLVGAAMVSMFRALWRKAKMADALVDKVVEGKIWVENGDDRLRFITAYRVGRGLE
jgi:hypothetical protein